MRTETEAPDPAGVGIIQLCDYVDLPFEQVVQEFEAPGAPALFERALEKVTGLPAQVRSAQSAVVSNHVARFPMSWCAGAFEGQATITTIVLHAGRHPITELLVRVDAPAAAEASGLGEDGTIHLLRNFLHVLTNEMAETAADAAGPAEQNQ